MKIVNQAISFQNPEEPPDQPFIIYLYLPTPHWHICKEPEQVGTIGVDWDYGGGSAKEQGLSRPTRRSREGGQGQEKEKEGGRCWTGTTEVVPRANKGQ